MRRERRPGRSGATVGATPSSRGKGPAGLALLVLTAAGGCASGSAALLPPATPADLGPHLQRYEQQLAQAGVTVTEATAYFGGETELAALDGDGPLGGDGVDLGEPRNAGDPSAPTAVARAPQQTQFTSWKMLEEVPEYRIGPGDILQVTTFLGPEAPQQTNYRVLADGTIFVPRFQIGEIRAGGLTPTELSRELSDRYRRYVPEGYAEARVLEYNAWEATLVGEIRVGQNIGPGSYLLRGRETVAEFIFSHGGPTPNADLTDVRLVRNGAETRLNLAAALSGTGGQNPPLDAGDVIRVPSITVGASRYFILGEVGDPGVFTLTEGLTALDAIAQAGSYGLEADTSAAFIARPSTGEIIALDLDAVLGQARFSGDVAIRAGDFLVVPRRDRSFWEKTRDWISLTTLVVSVATVVELIRRD